MSRITDIVGSPKKYSPVIIVVVVLLVANIIGNSLPDTNVNNSSNPLYIATPTPTPKLSAIPTLTPEMESQAEKQTIADRDAGLQVTKIIEKDPYLAKLPISTKNYYVIFDFQKDSIRVRLRGTSTQSQISAEIKTKLKQIGVPDSVPVYYLPAVSPTPIP